jgi:hypothetical protein
MDANAGFTDFIAPPKNAGATYAVFGQLVARSPRIRVAGAIVHCTKIR